MITEFSFTVEPLPEKESQEEKDAAKLSEAAETALKELSEIDISDDAPKEPPTARSRQVEFDGSFRLDFD